MHNPSDTVVKMSSIQTRRILILCEQGLLWRGIQSLLASDPRLTIVGITDNLEDARMLLKTLEPDALIVDQAHFPLSVHTAQSDLQFDPPPMLVTLDESDNRIRIHHIQERALNSPNELIEALVT